jgi:spermidine/putrescine transport system ATP-binding protein
MTSTRPQVRPEPEAAATTSVVELTEVSKHYGRTAAVDNVSIDVGKEFFSLLGPSGSGKTSLLRIVAGFAGIDSGRVTIAGKDVTRVPPHLRPCNTVFQQYALFPHLTVAGNVAFGLKEQRLPRAEIQTRVKEALELVHLLGSEKKLPSQMSGGQQQRVALARALVNRPTVLLLDEPLAALDAKLRKGMQLELKRLQQEVGISFIYVTHDQEEALVMSDRLAVMSEGRVQQVGTPQEVYDRPSSPFVAEFIGASNLLPAQLIGQEPAGFMVRLTSGDLVQATSPGQHVVGTMGRLMVRPEDVVADKLDVRRKGGLASGMVASQAFLGSATRLEIRLANDVRLIAIRDRHAGDPLAVGDSVSVSWPNGAARFFEGEA